MPRLNEKSASEHCSIASLAMAEPVKSPTDPEAKRKFERCVTQKRTSELYGHLANVLTVSKTVNMLTHAKRLRVGALGACTAMAVIGKCVQITSSKLDLPRR